MTRPNPDPLVHQRRQVVKDTAMEDAVVEVDVVLVVDVVLAVDEAGAMPQDVGLTDVHVTTAVRLGILHEIVERPAEVVKIKKEMKRHLVIHSRVSMGMASETPLERTIHAKGSCRTERKLSGAVSVGSGAIITALVIQKIVLRLRR